MTEAVSIRRIDYGTPDYAAEVAFRETWLRKPLGQVFTPEQLAPDAQSVHFLAEAEGAIVGCVQWKRHDETTAQLRQLVVGQAWRGQGLGAQLVRLVEQEAREAGFACVMLHARVEALPFYQRLGYREEGEEFLSVGIPHRLMRKRL